MKKLTNVSPFILLLFPVFVVMLLAFMSNNTESNEVVAKTTANTKTAGLVKVATAILK